MHIQAKPDLCLLVLLLIGGVVAAQDTMLPSCGCTEQFNSMQTQQSITEQNLKAYMAMYMNQTSNKFDAQYINFDSKLTAAENRIINKIEQKIIQETDPLKFEIAALLAGLASAGTIMALYIAIGG